MSTLSFLFIFFIGAFASTGRSNPALISCETTTQQARTDGVLPVAVTHPLLIFQNIIFKTPYLRGTWRAYLINVAETPPRPPLAGGIFVRRSGKPLPTEINEWAAAMDEALGNRDAWVRWNMFMGDVIRGYAKDTGKDMYTAMLEILKTEAKERGFSQEFLVLDEGDLGPESWRAMLRRGQLFVDQTFPGGGNETSHTPIAHLLQLLYVQRMLEVKGFPPGTMSKIMRDFLGNHELVSDLKLVRRGDAKKPAKEKFESPWADLFDADYEDRRQAQRPEWFGHMWYILAPDIPYGDISKRLPANYP